jgi:hypothetical protein
MAEKLSIHSPLPRIDPHSHPVSPAVASGGYGVFKTLFYGKYFENISRDFYENGDCNQPKPPSAAMRID